MKNFNNEILWNKSWNSISKNVSESNFAKKTYDFLLSKNFNFKKGSSLLDLGCGDGKDSIYFLKNNFKVTSLDFSKSAIELFRLRSKKEKNLEINPIISNILELDLNFKKNSFDIIYANLSLHYFDDFQTKKIFSDIFKILKNNGLLFVNCKSDNDFKKENFKEISKNLYLINNKQYNFFSKNYLKSLTFNFKTIEILELSKEHLSIDSKISKVNFICGIFKKL